jgi:uncharacterized OB-fold protein
MSFKPPFSDPAPGLVDAPFWQGCNQGRLLVQRCPSCERFIHPPLPFCPNCRLVIPIWVACAGVGVIYSVTTVHRAQLAGVKQPYRVAIGDMAEGWRLLCNVLGTSLVAMDDTVRVVFVSSPSGQMVPAFELLRDQAPPILGAGRDLSGRR